MSPDVLSHPDRQQKILNYPVNTRITHVLCKERCTFQLTIHKYCSKNVPASLANKGK